MTLHEWETIIATREGLPLATARVVNTHANGAKWIPDNAPDDLRRQLWALDDYRVSSVSGGTIWLIERKGN